MVKKLLPFLVIVFVWLVFSKPFFIDGKIPFPADLAVNKYNLWSSYEKYWSPIKNPAQPDIIDQIYPWKKLTIATLQNGEIPFWNPYSFSGTPHLANYQSSTFSITNLFYFLLEFNKAWALAVLAQPLMAGIFTFMFIKSLKRSSIASLISAISFMFSGFLTTWMGYTTLGLAIGFLPLGLFAIEKYTHTRKIYFLILLSLVFPLSFFSGHFQTSLYFSIFLFAYILFKYIDTKNKKDFAYLFSFSFLGLLLAMPQILPSIEFYFSSVRSSVFQKIEAVPIKYLTTIISPDYFGNPVTRNNYFGNYIEWASFSGTLTFFLALFSLLNKNKFVVFFLISALISILISLDTFVTDALVRIQIPVLSTSALGRVLVIFSFSISVLAAFGLDYLVDQLKTGNKGKIFKWIILCFSILALTWFLAIGKLIDPNNYQIAIKNLILPTALTAITLFLVIVSIQRKVFIKLSLILILILIIFDMLRFANKWQVFEDQNLIFPRTTITNKLQSLDNTYRTLGSFGSEGSVYFEFPSTEGYDPLYINRYGEFIASLDDGKIKSSPRSGVVFNPNAKYSPKVFDLLGIKYVLGKKLDEDEVWGFPFSKYPDKFETIYEDEYFTIHENKEVLPRTYLVTMYEVMDDNQKIISSLLADDFDFSNNVILETDPKFSIEKESTGSANIISYEPNRIEIDVNTENESILFLTDNYYPGWRAAINGEEKEILRTNYTFRGVVVPEGKSRVVFYYESDTFNNGLIIAVISGVLILIISAGKWYTTKKKRAKKKK